MSDEPQEPASSPSGPISHKLIDVVIFGFLVAVATFCLLLAAVYLAEGLGPTRTEEGVVTERSVTNDSIRRCRPGQVCRTESTRRGTVVGQLTTGEQWLVANTAAYDLAPPPDTEVKVETSLLTGRVSGFVTPGQPDNSWSSTGSVWLKIFIGMLLVIGLVTLRIVVSGLSKVRGQAGRASPSVAGAVLGLALGLYGVWNLAFAALQ